MQSMQSFDASKFVSRQQQLAEIIKNTPEGGTYKDFRRKVPNSLIKNMAATLKVMFDKGILTRTRNHRGTYVYFYDRSSENSRLFKTGPAEEFLKERSKTRAKKVSLQELAQTLIPYNPPLLPAPVSMKQELEHRLNEHMLKTEEVLMEPTSAQLPEVLPKELKVERQVTPQEIHMVVGYKGGQEALYLTGLEAKELYLTLHKVFG